MTSITANGIRLEYDTFGDPGDPALVLIIGFGLQMTAWPAALCRGLAGRGFQVIRFDNRDTGLSEKFAAFGTADLAAAFARLGEGGAVEAPYSEEDMADDVAGLLDALGIARAHICGMSMGGRIAQRVALRHPERVASLTVMMSTSGDPGLPAGDAAVREILFSAPEDPDSLPAIVELSLKIYRAVRGTGFDYDAGAFRRQVEQDLARSADIEGYQRTMLGMAASPAFYHRLGEVAAPTLVLHGSDDPVLPPAAGQDVADRIPGARMTIIEGWGHEVFAKDLAPLLIEAIADHCGAVRP